MPLTQHIDMFKWLNEVLQHLGGSPLQVVTTERQQFKKITNSFEIPSRQDVGTMIPIVASGKESPIQIIYERSVMEACLLELERHGYLISNLSCSKSKRFNRINMILLFCVRALHKKIYIRRYVSSY